METRTIIRNLLLGLLPSLFALALMVVSAVAQNAPATDPKSCAPSERLQSDGSNAPQVKDGEPLSDKLARTGGVLCPPDVGTDMRAPAPGGGRTPVIPPPGSPGGDQSVQPK